MPRNGNLREKLSKVSSPFAKNSRFQETLRGDFFRSALSGGAAANFAFKRLKSDQLPKDSV
jgi:hypothetical protein